MVVRIVRMHFKEGSAAGFLQIFDEHKHKIRNFPGCTHLELLTDARTANRFTTLSHWNSEASLDAYRQSPLFEEVWARVKPMFSGRTEAFTLAPLMRID
jgi:quinol monooxygenase YgiN